MSLYFIMKFCKNNSNCIISLDLFSNKSWTFSFLSPFLISSFVSIVPIGLFAFFSSCSSGIKAILSAFKIGVSNPAESNNINFLFLILLILDILYLNLLFL